MKTIGCFKVDENIIEKMLGESYESSFVSDDMKKLFNEEKAQNYIDNNDFDEFFDYVVDYRGKVHFSYDFRENIVACLLLAGIDFLPYVHKSQYGKDNLDELLSGLDFLISVDIPKNLTEVYLYGCKNLSSVIIEEGVEVIRPDAFFDCEALSQVKIPRSVKLIGQGAFMYCNSLKEIYYNGTKKEWRMIERRKDWKRNSALEVIHCSDGDIKV